MKSESMEIFKIKSISEIPENFTGIAKLTNGVQIWCRNGKYHRENGPAVIWPSGRQNWYLNGELHREDGPAIICLDGTQAWYRNGKYHREDGPAVIWPDGKQFWFLNGIKMTPMELFEKLSVEQKEKALWNLNQWK